MFLARINPWAKFLRPSWLTGPILGKELRVSSRRRRNYSLRFIYLALLTLFVVLVWISVVRIFGPTSAQVSRMSLAGQTITATIVWFQFCAAQLIIIIMLSTAISDEIYHRTLGILMTTPITSFQIIAGKLCSKLLQILLLLAISLPLLAVVRIFGGVPWNYLISSLCITLTATIFAGSLSLFFSIYSQRAYGVILRTLFTLGVLYALLPLLVAALILEDQHLLGRTIISNLLLTVWFHTNPFAALGVNTEQMFSPPGVGVSLLLSWPLHCLVLLLASILILSAAVRVVRRVALRSITQSTGDSSKRSKAPAARTSVSQNEPSPEISGIIRPVSGSPVVWRELRSPLIRGGRKKGLVGLVITLVIVLLTYVHTGIKGYLDEDFTHLGYALTFLTLGLVVTVTLPSASITAEKEARTWPILLATPLGDWSILWGKAAGALRRCLPIWLFFAGHVIFFTFVRYIHPLAVVHLILVVIGPVVFLIGSGLYFSARFRQTTSAVIANTLLALGLWAGVPGLLSIVNQMVPDYNVLGRSLSVNPLIQTGTIMVALSGRNHALLSLSQIQFHWSIHSPYTNHLWSDAGSTTILLLLIALGYVIMGLCFAWRAKCRLRCNIF
jgi:ABC-2 type transport system permease protein